MKTIYTALAKAQAEMPAVPMDGVNPHYKSKYATLGAVLKTCQPVLAKHGLAVTQLVSGSDGVITMTTCLVHESGEQISATIDWPFTGDIQKAGSAITYLRRYQLSSILGMYADEDNDGQGQAADNKKPAQPDALKKGRALYAELAARAAELGIQPDDLPDDITVGALREQYADLKSFVESAEKQEGENE